MAGQAGRQRQGRRHCGRHRDGQSRFRDRVAGGGHGAGAVLAYSFVLSYIIGKLVDLTIGFRITVDQELAGIDLAIHAERGYEFSDNNQGNFLASSKGA